LTIGGVPVYGKSDACYQDTLNNVVIENCPHDWKTSNPLSDNSPKARFYNSWDFNGKEHGSHKEYTSNMPFEEIDEGWADQLCTYGWLERISPIKVLNLVNGKEQRQFRAFPARIHQLTARKGVLRVSEYRGIITEAHQLKVLNKYINAWKQIVSKEFLRDKPFDIMYAEASNERWY
jgi:hypothetical protein